MGVLFFFVDTFNVYYCFTISWTAPGCTAFAPWIYERGGFSSLFVCYKGTKSLKNMITLFILKLHIHL